MSDFTGIVELPRCDGVVDRRTFIPQRAAGQRVVHLGCVDEHLTAARAGTGNLLHEELDAVASSLVGVDISKPGLDLLGEICPGSYVHGDVERLDELEFDDFDLVVAAELIEHLGRPAAFLGHLRNLLERHNAEAILSTPNAYSWAAFTRFAKSGVEATHPDHRLCYSPATLEESLRRAGIRPTERFSHGWQRDGRSLRARAVGYADRVIQSRRPWLGTGLVWVVRAD